MKNVYALAFAAALMASPAFAQTSSQTGNSGNDKGTTSGPAAGSTVQPSTATEKQQGNKPSEAAGDPGMAAKKNSESGAKPDKPHR